MPIPEAGATLQEVNWRAEQALAFEGRRCEGQVGPAEVKGQDVGGGVPKGSMGERDGRGVQRVAASAAW